MYAPPYGIAVILKEDCKSFIIKDDSIKIRILTEEWGNDDLTYEFQKRCLIFSIIGLYIYINTGRPKYYIERPTFLSLPSPTLIKFAYRPTVIQLFSVNNPDHFVYSFVFMNSKTNDFYKLYFATCKLSSRA